MCGIIGAFSRKVFSLDDQRIQSALLALKHRGPDDRGVEVLCTGSGALLVGHTRLSIIDLSSGGHQPMHTHDGRYTIVYNGEVYNFRELRKELKLLGHCFMSNTDSEVLLAAWAQWGVDVLRRLVGMFAFAVFDRVDETLTLVRDAFGIKPLFYAPTDDGLVFASELPALLAMRGETTKVNVQRAYDYLVHQVQDSGFETFVQGVYHLPPAHWLQIDLRFPEKFKAIRWWNPSIDETSELSFPQAAERLRELFLDSVRFHLRSDVPLAVALSGGVDSSAIACCVRHLEPEMDLHTFSYVAVGSPFSEEYWIDLVNAHVDAVPHKISMAPSELAADIHDLIRQQGEPFCTTSMYAQYRVFRAAKDAGMKVVLEGQGADELLAGYYGYQGQRMRSLWERGDLAGMGSFANQWRQWPGREKLSPWRAFIGQMLPNRVYQLSEQLSGLRPTPNWIDQEVARRLGVVMSPHRRGAPGGKGRRVIEELLRAMSEGGLPSLLRYGDRNAMRFSIENRVPFLTLSLVEFVFCLPENYLIADNGETKSVFRAAMRGIVPDAILNRRDKIGFETPMQGLVVETLKSRLVCKLKFISEKKFQERMHHLNINAGDFTAQDWRLLNLTLWNQMLEEGKFAFE